VWFIVQILAINIIHAESFGILLKFFISPVIYLNIIKTCFHWMTLVIYITWDESLSIEIFQNLLKNLKLIIFTIRANIFPIEKKEKKWKSHFHSQFCFSRCWRRSILLGNIDFHYILHFWLVSCLVYLSRFQVS